MLYGLDLFSGIGGLSLALEGYARPVAYCESERFAQGVLLSRMASGELPVAPIWNDVRTLEGGQFRDKVQIIYGGFPCQDLSVAGLRKGLEGERSGLFFEIMRLVDDIRPRFIFLENVPNIVNTGLESILAEITERGYDSRWTMLSAAEVGASHKRNRWWLLAHARGSRLEDQQLPSGAAKRQPWPSGHRGWETESEVDRTADGIPRQLDRIRGLGNAVVPKQARAAFEKLMGLEQ